MPHVDEGTLHALLDGELGAAEVLEVQTHFATCPACAKRLDEARHMLTETERLVSALERQASPQPAAPSGAPSGSRIMVGRPMIPLDPLVLIPDNPTPTEVRRSRSRIMAWAAGFLVIVGAGFFGLQMRGSLPTGKRVGTLRIRPGEFTTTNAKETDSTIAVAKQPPHAADSGDPLRQPSPFAAVKTGTPPLAPNDRKALPSADKAGAAAGAPEKPELASDKTAPAPAPKPAAPAAQKAAAAQQKPAPAPAEQQKPPAPQPKRAPTQVAPTPPRDVAKQTTAPGAAGQTDASNAADSEPTDGTLAAEGAGGEDRSAAAARSAKATEELDRERMRERGAAATAELDRQREEERQRAAAAAAAAPKPAVPTIDQQARLSSRIGLDEAAHQLGGPLHAIDGMTRQLVGLVSPQLVPGSDNTRSVVRAVYVDRTGRTIYLDQQRVRPGQLDLPYTPQTGPNGQQMWMSGSVLLVLQGDLSADSLRSLSRRVR